MRASTVYSRHERHREPRANVQTHTDINKRFNTETCFERQPVAEYADATLGASLTPPLCERHL